MSETTQQIFIVTEGKDSNYSIVGVFSSEEKANWYIKEAQDEWSEFRVKPYVVDAIVNRQLHHYKVDMAIKNRSAKVYLKDDSEDEPGKCADTEPIIYHGEIIRWYSIIAKNKDHAIRKANEKLSALIAANRLQQIEHREPEWELKKEPQKKR